MPILSLGKYWPTIRRAIKALVVSTALLVFIASGVLLWSFRTGRAVQFVRSELLAQLYEECEVIAGFDRVEVGLFPPQISLSGVSLADRYGGQIASVEEAILKIAILPFFYGRFQLTEVAALGPSATLVFDYGRILNLPACFEQSETDGPSRVLGVDELRIERGHFRLIMPQRFEARLDDIDIELNASSSGGSDLFIGVDDGLVRVRDREVLVKRFRLSSHIAGLLSAPRALSFQSLEIDLDGIAVTGRGAIDFLGPVIEAQLKTELDLSALKKFFDDLPDLEGQAKAEISVLGPLLNPRLVGSIESSGARLAEFKLGDKLKIDFQADEKALQIRKLEIALGQGRIEGRGRIDFDKAKEFPLQLDLQSKQFPLGRLVDALGIHGAWVDGELTGKVNAEGHIRPQLNLFGSIEQTINHFFVFRSAWDSKAVLSRGPTSDVVMLALGPTQFRGRFSTDGKSVQLKQAHLHRGQSDAHIEARFDLDSKGRLSLSADFERLDFADLGPIAGLGISGVGPFAAQFSGRYEDPRAVGNCALRDVVVGGIPFGHAAGTLSWHRRRILLESIEGRLGRSRYNGDVAINLEDEATLNISGEVTRGRIRDLLLPIGISWRDVGDFDGDVRATFDLQGPPRFLTGPVNLEIGAFEIFGEKFDKGRIVGRVDSGSLVAESAEFRKRGSRLAGSIFFNPNNQELRIRAHTRDLTLQKLDLVSNSTKELDGPMSVFIDSRGSLHGMTGTITVTLDHLIAGKDRFAGGQFRGHIHGAQVNFNADMLGKKMKIDGKIGLRSGLPYAATLSLSPFDLPRFAGALRGDSQWTGAVEGEAKLKGQLGSILDSSGDLWIKSARFETPKLRLETTVPTKMKLRRRLLDIKNLLVTGPTTRLQASGRVGRRLIDLRIQGLVDLAIAESTLGFVERSAGQLNLETVVRGSASSIDLLGTGTIQGGALQLKGLPGKLSGLSADLVFSQSAILIENAHGRFDGGRTSIKGQVFLDGLLPSQVALEFEFDKVRPVYVSPKFDLRGLISGKVSLEGRLEQMLMRGAVSVKRGVLTPKFDWRSLVGDPMQRLAPKVYDPSSEIMSFDIGVELKDPLRIKSDTADILMSGAVTMTGTNQRMGLIGNVNVLEGRVGILGREYEFESGVIDFKDRMRFYPRYDLSLRANACSARIGLLLVGTFDQFDTTFNSKPEMSDTDIVSCLVRGVRIKDLENLSGSAIGGAAAGLAGEALWRFTGVDRQVRKVLPVDQIEITTEYSSRARLYEPRLLIAKEVLEGQVRLEFSSSLFNTDDQSIKAHYRVTPFLTLQSGWTSSEDMAVGDLGLDLKYRWEW